MTAGSKYMLNKPSVFEIYSPGKSIIIEVFSCKGDIDVLAGSNYNKLMQEDESNVRLEHANYAGHYVITSSNLSGEYYLKTSNPSPES